MAFDQKLQQLKLVLLNMGLNDYQSSALSHLILLGETKATTLSKTTGVPSARIYGVLDNLAKVGLITVKPGRPILYSPRPPTEIALLLISLGTKELKQKISMLESYGKELENIGQDIYLKGRVGTSRPSLLQIVAVGEVSIKETINLYEQAKQEILILSKAIEYLPAVEKPLRKAAERGVSIRIILLNPELLEPENRKKQTSMLRKIEKMGFEDLIHIRFANEVPMRGCIIDAAQKGKALFLVEEPGVPFSLREAAITFHQSVVKGLASMFQLVWECKSETYKPI